MNYGSESDDDDDNIVLSKLKEKIKAAQKESNGIHNEIQDHSNYVRNSNADDLF